MLELGAGVICYQSHCYTQNAIPTLLLSVTATTWIATTISATDFKCYLLPLLLLLHLPFQPMHLSFLGLFTLFSAIIYTILENYQEMLWFYLVHSWTWNIAKFQRHELGFLPRRLLLWGAWIAPGDAKSGKPQKERLAYKLVDRYILLSPLKKIDHTGPLIQI